MKDFRSNLVTTGGMWTHENLSAFIFEILVGWENCFRPSGTEGAALLFWNWLPVADILSLGLLCNCTRVTQSWSAWGAGRDSSWFTRFTGLSHIFFTEGGKYISGSIRDSCGLFPFSRRAHRKGLAGVLLIIISRIDALLLNCWIKEKQKSPLFFTFDAAVL